MGSSFQVRDQFACYFLTFQVVGWVDIEKWKYYCVVCNYAEYTGFHTNYKYRNVSAAAVLKTNK